MQINKNKNVKESIPKPEDMNLDFLIQHTKHAEKLLKNDHVDLSTVTKNKMYPEINGEVGRGAGMRFVQGLVHLELGKIYRNDKGGQSFKRYHPDHDESPNKEELRRKWKVLNIED